jgi:hypothetical protein
VQDQLTFDPSVNPNSGDKLLRAQLLQRKGTNALLANPSAPRGAAAAADVTPEQALREVRVTAASCSTDVLQAYLTRLAAPCRAGTFTCSCRIRTASLRATTAVRKTRVADCIASLSFPAAGPLFLLPGLVIALHIAGIDLGPRGPAMITHLLNHQQVGRCRRRKSFW